MSDRSERKMALVVKGLSQLKGWEESVAWGGLCLRFHPKCSKFGTVLHLGPKILGKIKIKILGLKGPFF